MFDKNAKIGVFDSGVGGLTVLKELVKIMPNEEYIYLADLKNSPYGEKDGDTIEKMSRNIIEYFISLDVKMIVVACNTASSYNMDKIKKDYDVPIFTVLESAIKAVGNEKKNLLLAATTATVKAGAYDNLIGLKLPDSTLYKEACKDVVPSIEEKNLKEFEIQDIVDSYIKKYRTNDIDLLILGCTHYPIWVSFFSKSIGEEVEILDPAHKLAEDVYNYLKEADLLANNSKSAISYIVTDKKEQFFKNGKKLMNNLEVKNIKLIEI